MSKVVNPLVWAVTIHKGMTVDEIVVDMSEEMVRYRMGHAYVALSRVKTCRKFHVINWICNSQLNASLNQETAP